MGLYLVFARNNTAGRDFVIPMDAASPDAAVMVAWNRFIRFSHVLSAMN